MSTSHTKELILLCAGGIKGVLDVGEHDTLATVRTMIDQELDDDLIVPDFAFHVDSVRISRKQEEKKMAWSVLGKVVSLETKRPFLKRPFEQEDTFCNNSSVKNQNVRHEEDVDVNTVKAVNDKNSNRQRQVPHDAEKMTYVSSSLSSPSSSPPCKKQRLNSNDNNIATSSTTPTTHSKENKESNEDVFMTPVRKADMVVTPYDCDGDGDCIGKLNGNNSGDGDEITCAATPTRSNLSAVVLPSSVNIISKKLNDVFENQQDLEDHGANNHDDDNDIQCRSAAGDDDKSAKIEFYTYDDEVEDEDIVEQDIDHDEVDSVSNKKDGNENCKDCNANDELDTASMTSPFKIDFKGSMEEEEEKKADDVNEGNVHDKTSDVEEVTIERYTNDNNRLDKRLDIPNSNYNAERALELSCSTLNSIKALLEDNPLFCSNDRREEWLNEINERLATAAPKTIIGVLGNTGVGKSSLLNALLDEASVLPTSGSRGCTAAVVELRFNSELLEQKNRNDDEVPVYRGIVEFITLDEWRAELKILVEECSTQENKVFIIEPDPQTAAEAAAAWTKIDQVYGKGTMHKYRGKKSSLLYDKLAGDVRIIGLLRPKPGTTYPYNTIAVEEGAAIPGSPVAQQLVASYKNMGARLIRKQKKWAQSFRAQINSYVYRKGNGHEPQTWPLIRKVVLFGPWACLSTGACLVDLPGVRDANAARAKVAEQYLQNCNKIWIVAPIKRAVDDGTAKELLGAQFKRRLLMDGQYGNCSFICTQTDDCEPTEIMRDHADVAQLVEGRWEKMTSLSNDISSIEDAISKLLQQEEELQDELEDAAFAKKCKEEELAELNDEFSYDDTQVNFNYLAQKLGKMQRALDVAIRAEKRKKAQLIDWRKSQKGYIDEMQSKCETVQRHLKTLCAQVRNEYSTQCLQSDFRAGLKELYRESRGTEEDQENNTSPEQTALPDDFELDVFCISSNDYLKIQGIKPKSDGASNTFFEAEDTQIPRLRTFVHETTAHTTSSFTKSFVHHSSDIYDRIKLLATDAANVPRGRTSLRCMRVFEQEINKIGQQILPLTKEFSQKMQQKVKTGLEPALEIGSKNGISAALPICESWGSKSRRSAHHRDPFHNGLYWATYQATVRREGVFRSGSAGSIDMNHELCDPMEKEFSVDWQRTLDSALRVHLGEAESKVQEICNSVNNTITLAFEKEGMDKNHLVNMSNTASRGCMNAVRAAFASMHVLAINTQRNLNRSLLPLVQQQMRKSYSAALMVERGKGVFDRMKDKMLSTTKLVVNDMFHESKITLLSGIQEMVNQLVDLIQKTSHTIAKHLEDVYSICWDDQIETQKIIDPEMKQKIRQCRDALLPSLNKLHNELVAAQELVGIERESLELDVMAVDSLDATIQRKIDDAQAKGEIIDLCDSDDEDTEYLFRTPSNHSFYDKVKAEFLASNAW